jgi:hypothetical protein
MAFWITLAHCALVLFYLSFFLKYLNSPDVRQVFSGLDYVKHGKWHIGNETTYPLLTADLSVGVDVAGRDQMVYTVLSVLLQ